MSLKSNRNLIIVGGIAVALLIGTVLLAGYSRNQTFANNTASQVTVQPAASGTCPMAKTAFNAETCPAGRTEPCCAEEGKTSECEKPCPDDCTKPCCAEEGAEAGCPMQSQSSGCCPIQTEAAAAK